MNPWQFSRTMIKTDNRTVYRYHDSVRAVVMKSAVTWKEPTFFTGLILTLGPIDRRLKVAASLSHAFCTGCLFMGRIGHDSRIYPHHLKNRQGKHTRREIDMWGNKIMREISLQLGTTLPSPPTHFNIDCGIAITATAAWSYSQQLPGSGSSLNPGQHSVRTLTKPVEKLP